MRADLNRPGTGGTQPRQRGQHRAGSGGLRRAGRLRELLFSGVVDSFGMALGWTVFVLLATARGGLAEAALYNAAMLAGVVLSAPVTGWRVNITPAASGSSSDWTTTPTLGRWKSPTFWR